MEKIKRKEHKVNKIDKKSNRQDNKSQTKFTLMCLSLYL